MSHLIAIDVAVLPPLPLARRAIELSAALPEEESQGLRLDDTNLPHVTLTQQFVPAGDVDAVAAGVDAALTGLAPLRLSVVGADRGNNAVWIAIERTPELLALHERLMDRLQLFERSDGTPAAFVDGDARPSDVLWVSEYRRNSSFGSFLPHITLGHASRPPAIEPAAFEADTVALCQLGRFCACRRVLKQWAVGRGR
jgi:2'-5' RNA ligase